jgi:ribosome maturation factor RimP
LSNVESHLVQLTQPSIEAMGFELIGVEYIRAGNNSIVRFYIDHADGIEVDHCAEVSRQISSILDVDDPIQSHYSLEVSSPGIERPLFTLEHYLNFIGEKVQVKLRMPMNGLFKLVGKIVAVESSLITFDVADKLITVSIDNIRQANIIVDF